MTEEMDIDARIKKFISSTEVTKCIECGECTGSCPVAAINKDFSPRGLGVKASIGTETERKELIEGREIWLCNTCGICNAVCPYGVDFVSFVLGLREIASSQGYGPSISPCLGLFLTDRIRNGSCGDSSKMRWVTDELEIGEEGDVYYFSGCISFLDLAYKDRKNLNLLEIPRSAVKILNSIGIVPAVSKKERCCGHDLLWVGEREKAKELARANIDAIKETGAKTVVFTCPEGLRTVKMDYENLLGEKLGLDLVHISEFLLDKDIPLRGGWGEETLTYHDSCRLKHLKIYDAPREILKKIPNVKIYEMRDTRDKSPCCGVSAMATCGPISKQMEVKRINEAKETGASNLIVPCPKCLIHLDCALSLNPSLSNGFSISEFTTTVASHLIPRV